MPLHGLEVLYEQRRKSQFDGSMCACWSLYAVREMVGGKGCQRKEDGRDQAGTSMSSKRPSFCLFRFCDHNPNLHLHHSS